MIRSGQRPEVVGGRHSEATAEVGRLEDLTRTDWVAGVGLRRVKWARRGEGGV